MPGIKHARSTSNEGTGIQQIKQFRKYDGCDQNKVDGGEGVESKISKKTEPK